MTSTGDTPRFQTERLVLRPFTLDDVDEVHELLDLDPEDPGMALEERRKAIVYRATQIEWDDGIGSYAIAEHTTGQLLGYVGLQFHLLESSPLARPEIELFYGLGRAHWGKGYAFEACSAMRDHAFDVLRLGRLVSVTERTNERSVRLLRRLSAAIQDHPTKPHLVIGVIQRPGSTATA